MSGPEVAWYVTRLAQIPCPAAAGTGMLDNAAAAAECRRIGYEIERQWATEGMMQVWQACRGALDPATAAAVARAWAGIGQWQG
jgi:hypothetical protein